MMITEITPSIYIDSEEHRAVADSVIAQAGLDKRDVRRMDLVDGVWNVTVFSRDATGRFFCKPGTKEVATEVVTVDAALITTT